LPTAGFVWRRAISVTLSLRIKVAIGVWLMCILSFIELSRLEPVIGWWDWLVASWALGKIGLFGYAAFLLITADEEIENLRASNQNSERLIEEILKKVNSPKTS
jgi:hypothetical protein